MQNIRIIHPSKRWWLDLRLKCWAGAHVTCFQFGGTAQASQCAVLPMADPTCLTPAVARWAVLHCDLNMLSAMEMLNKVKISFIVWTARFPLKALILHEFVRALCWLWKSTLSSWCCTLHFALAGLCVWAEGNTCHFSGRDLSNFFLQQYSLGLFAAGLVCNSPHLFCPLHVPSPFPSSSFFFFLQLPFPSHHCSHCCPLAVPSFALCPPGFLLLHYPHVPSLLFKTNGSIPSITSCLLLCGSEIWTLLFGRLHDCFYTSFLSFHTVLDHSRGCWAYSLPKFTLKYSFTSSEQHCLWFFLITPFYPVLPTVHPAPPNQFSILNSVLAFPSPQCTDDCHNEPPDSGKAGFLMKLLSHCICLPILVQSCF